MNTNKKPLPLSSSNHNLPPPSPPLTEPQGQSESPYGAGRLEMDKAGGRGEGGKEVQTTTLSGGVSFLQAA